MSAAAELRDWLDESLDRCSSMRWHGAAFRFRVAGIYAADAAAEQKRLSSEAYAGRVEIDEALALLSGSDAADTRTASALAQLRRCRERLHDLADTLARGAAALVLAIGLGATAAACLAGNNDLRAPRRETRTARRFECACHEA